VSNIIRLLRNVVLSCVVILAGCDQSNADESSAGNIRGYNHVANQHVNWFTVNGYRATLTGNTCCVMIPDKWRPGLMVHIEWEVDPNPDERLPPLGTTAYNKAYAEHKAKYKQYIVDVPIPEYDESGGMNVHFLPCHQVKVNAGIASYGADTYPIKEPIDMQEPATCPK
jgi:hypothetical protein